MKIIEGANGPFVAMPSRKLTAHCPNCGCKNHLRAAYCNQCGVRLKEPPLAKDEEGRAKLYADIAHPINSACREMIQAKVIAAYEQEKARSKLPGYVPQKYDDYDYEELPAAPKTTSPPKQAPVAEQPRGPHKPLAEKTPAKPDAPGQFGAGVFD